jgi:hypothetical protein
MAQAWYQKTGVQSAIAGGMFLIIAAMIPSVIERFGLKKENAEIKADLSTAQAEVQRLETLLTPFRTIALEKYTGDEREALLKLAGRINELEGLNIEKTKELESLKEQLRKVSEQAKPVILDFHSLEVSKDEGVVVTKIQFFPSKNENPGAMVFLVQLPTESNNEIVKIWPTLDGGGFSTGKDSFKASEDKKAARLAYQLMVVGRSTFEIRTTDFSKMKISGSHLEKALLIDNKTKRVQPVD